MPKPKKFLTDKEIEESTAQVLDKHVEGGRDDPALPIDIDAITECSFRFRIEWKPISDPPDCNTFATLLPTPDDKLHVAILTLNELYRDFLTEHPEIERLTRGHEAGHWEIHVDQGEIQTGLLAFGDNEPQPRYHRAKDAQRSLSPDQKDRLARFAFSDSRAYKVLKPRAEKGDIWIEPDWMHRQAEHFAACLLVPRKPLYRSLESGSDPAFYGTHVDLAELFKVSKRVIQIRLIKLKIIEEIAPGKFRNVKEDSRLIF